MVAGGWGAYSRTVLLKHQVWVLPRGYFDGTGAQGAHDCCGCVPVCLLAVVAAVRPMLQAVHLVAAVAGERQEVSLPARKTGKENSVMCPQIPNLQVLLCRGGVILCLGLPDLSEILSRCFQYNSKQ